MRTKMCAAVTLLAGVLALAGCGGGDDSSDGSPKADAPDNFDVAGTMTLTDSDGIFAVRNKAGSECVGDGGYDDIAEGVSVVIRDSRDEQIALGRLGAGHLTANLYSYTATCEFTFAISDVPANGSIYSVEVSHRGSVPFDRAEAASLALSLG